MLIPPGEYGERLAVTDWSPDGRYLLVRAGSGQGEGQAGRLMRVAVADGTVQVLRAPETEGPGQGMKFSPDGRYIAYYRLANRGEGGPNVNVYVIPADGGEETPLVERPGIDYLLGWAPDGSGVLFESNRTGSTAAWFLPVSEGRPQGDPRLVSQNLPDGYGFTELGITQDGAFYYKQAFVNRNTYFATLDPETGELTSPPATAPLGLVATFPRPSGRRTVGKWLTSTTEKARLDC